MAANDAVSMNVAENRAAVPMTIQENRAAVPMTVAEGGGTPGGLNRKADKVTGAAAGNLAGLDSTGNLTDSGKAPGDFLEAPATAGTQGQVYTSDGQGGASWQDPTGGDPTEIIDDNAGSGDTDKVWSADKSHALLTEINSNKNCIEYKFSGSDLLLAFGYSNDNDYVIVMNCGRANGLFDFAKLCTKPKETPLKNLNTADLTTVWSSGTDMHGPFQFLAVNNADGYHSDAVSAGFVGGNHTLDQLGSGFETAISVYVNYYADGSPVSNGYGMATHFGIRWANDIQAYNTVKQGGGGRSCLREYHDIVFDGVCFKERITLKALEEIKMTLWYGLQCVSIGNAYSNIAFVDATNRGIFASSDASIKSGNAVTSGFIAWGNSHRIEMNVDTNIDLGKRTYYSGDKGAFVSNNKGYFYIIGTAVTMADGAEYYLDGSYRFIPNIVEGIPCTGIALDQNTLTFESAEETKTLTATVTPANTTDTVEWTSSDENIATVNSSGVVTIHGIGSVTITATCGSQTATASITQTTLKGEYGTKILENAAFGKDSSIAKVSSNADLNSLGQLYHDAIDDLHVRYGNGNANQIEFIRVPYGATKACIATTDSTAVNVSYGYLVDTTNLITVGTREFPEYVSQTTWVNTETGLSVEYGQAVGFTVTDAQLETLDYVYFK